MRKKKYWSKNLKWATAHLSTGWARRRARCTARVQGRWAQAGHAAGARSAVDARADAQGTQQGRAGHGRLGSLGTQPGRAAGQRAMHSVHSACF